MTSRSAFGQHVRDALARLYDPVHLQTHPLITLLALQPPPWGTAGEALRDLLRDAVASLRPPDTVPEDRPEWLGYNILWLRYVRLLEEPEICQELGISVATLYRHQREALDALASILWERYGHVKAPTAQEVEATEALTPEQARSRAISLAGASSRQPVNLADLLAGVRSTIASLAREKGVALDIVLPPQLPPVYAHPPVLRQIFLGLLAECIRSGPDRTLRLGVHLGAGELVWELRGLPSSALEMPLAGRAGWRMCQALLDLYQGRLRLARDDAGRPVISFTLPTARSRSVLIIDDDAATAALYRRYLERESFAVLEATTPQQAEALLAAQEPDLILLDVMMPQTDGWTLLQSLKANPRTAGLPVVVCSVIDQPDLALTLGAARVLTKPISPHELLQAVRELLAPTRPTDERKF